MTKLLMRCLVALSTVLVLSCGGGGGGSGEVASTAGSTESTNAIKDASSPEWGFAGQANANDGGGNGGGDAGSGAGSGTSGSSSSGGSSSGDTASASAGDAGGVGSGGTGASASAGDSGDSGVGGVGGVASIIVNDVRYDTTGAILRLRDASQLQLGMTAKVNGPTNADFTAGVATDVESAADARGVITSVDSGSGNLVVLGMTISTDATTVWGNVPGIGALTPGMSIQVWGLPAGPGVLRATRVEQVAGTPILSGVVQNLDVAGRRFLLGSLTIDFSQVKAPAALVAGVNVRVRAGALPASGLLQASSVELWYPVSLRDGTRRQLGGVVTDFSGITSFRVLGTPVDASSAQVSGGPAAAIANGVELDVAGTVSNGLLVATKIKIKKTPGGPNAASFTAKGTVGAFKSISDFKVKGQAIDASGAGIQFVNGSVTALSNGSKVTIVGARIVNDVLIATQVTFD